MWLFWCSGTLHNKCVRWIYHVSFIRAFICLTNCRYTTGLVYFNGIHNEHVIFFFIYILSLLTFACFHVWVYLYITQWIVVLCLVFSSGRQFDPCLGRDCRSRESFHCSRWPVRTARLPIAPSVWLFLQTVLLRLIHCICSHCPLIAFCTRC